MIGQFSEPYSPVRPLKFKVDYVAGCFVIYRQLFLTFIASEKLKLSSTLNYVLKRADD